MAATIMQGPTLANPDRFETVEELRVELHRANGLLFAQFAELAHIDEAASQLAGLINQVLLAHLRGDSIGIGALLGAYLSGRDRLREKLEEVIESEHIRTTH